MEHEEHRIRHPVYYRCEQAVLEIFQETQERVSNSKHTSIYEVMEQATAKDLFTGGTNEIFHNQV